MGRKRKTDPIVLADAVSRIKSGEWQLQQAAERCGIAISAMSTAVHRDDGIPLQKATDDTEGSTPLDRALAAAGVGDQGPGPDQADKGPSKSQPPPSSETRPTADKPVVSDADYCVGVVLTAKKIAVLGGGLWMGIPPLDDRLAKLGDLSKDLRKATEVASPELAPILKKWFPEGSLLLAFCVSLLFESLGTHGAMKELAKEHAAKRLEKKAEAEKKAAETPKAPPPPTNGQREPWLSKIKGAA